MSNVKPTPVGVPPQATGLKQATVKAEPQAKAATTAATRDSSQVKAPTGSLATPKAVDLNDVARTIGLGALATESVATTADAALNATDVVVNAEDAAKAIGALPRASAAQNQAFLRNVERARTLGKGAGIATAAVAAKALYDAVHPSLDVKAAAEALTNLALGLATAFEDVAPKALGAAGYGLGAISSLFALAANIKEASEQGLNASNVMGMLGNGLAAAGSIASLLPGGQLIGAALITAGAAVNLAKLAYDNWDFIKEKAGAGLTALKSFFGGDRAPEAARTVSVPRAAPAT